MSRYLFPGLLGLWMGLLLRWAGFADADGLRSALALRRGFPARCSPLRSGLAALGYAVAGSALLIWLAVLDTEALLALPLTWRVLAGGGLFGVCAGLCGFTPSTAFAGLGAGNALEALCTLTGVFVATLLLPEGEAVPAPAGNLLTQGCAGLLVAAIALCIPNPKTAPEAAAEPAPEAEALPEEVSSPELKAAPDSECDAVPEPDAVAEDAFVAILEGEEPLVVDTDPPEESAPAPEESTVNAGQESPAAPVAQKQHKPSAPRSKRKKRPSA